jgi:organic radical activating enzyme
MKIPVVEIFTSIQGEGPGLGLPSLFIRLGGCNLRCQFRGEACDTPYAVFTPEQLEQKNPVLKYGYSAWIDYTVEDLLKIIIAQQVRHLVWTGGEPLLWQGAIAEVHSGLQKRSEVYTAEIETNGTIALDELAVPGISTLFNVSVKLSSSNQERAYDQRRINCQSLKSFRLENSVYKFVIVDPKNDLREISAILAINRLGVYVMPEGASREELIQNSPEVVELAIANGFRFSPREHIVIWDTKKGI